WNGPVRLEKLDGRWLVMDFSIDGRSRLAAIVVGPLAEQRQPGVDLRVLGFDRAGTMTQVAIELPNTGTEPVKLARCYALVRRRPRLLLRRSPTPGGGPVRPIALARVVPAHLPASAPSAPDNRRAGPGIRVGCRPSRRPDRQAGRFATRAAGSP